MSMRSPSAFAVALALAACALPACSGGEDPAPHPQVTASDSEVRLAGPEEADLVLYVSNQSFEDEDVRLKLAVDGSRSLTVSSAWRGSTTGSASP